MAIEYFLIGWGIGIALFIACTIGLMLGKNKAQRGKVFDFGDEKTYDRRGE